jgi:hypothetical protein
MEKLTPTDVDPSLWECAKDILSHDTAGYLGEALRLLVESCDELTCLVSHAVELNAADSVEARC